MVPSRPRGRSDFEATRPARPPAARRRARAARSRGGSLSWKFWATHDVHSQKIFGREETSLGRKSARRRDGIRLAKFSLSNACPALTQSSPLVRFAWRLGKGEVD